MLNAVIDLSHFNANPDFAAAAQDGILGVIHKATQGLSYVDPTYAQREPLARAAGLLWGAYHFGTGDPAVEQAQHFLANIDDPANTLLVLDFEENSGGTSMDLDQAWQFVDYVSQQTGRFPGFYSGSYAKQLLGNSPTSNLTQCWLWLAQYGPTPQIPPCWPYWTMWQYTDGSNGNPPYGVDGIGTCDRDQFNGSATQLRKLWPS